MSTTTEVEMNGPRGGESSPNLQTMTTVTTTNLPNGTVTKVIVAVHGIGDQYSFATIQSVVNQFCKFHDMPAAIPLGNFHTGQAAFSLQPPYPADLFERYAFAEVYWAPITRKLADEKHTIEESKKWARTIVERLRLRWHLKGSRGSYNEGDFNLINQVLTEMIQTIAVLDRICYLADKAGLFTFDLRKLLDDYLGDVQVVTEFGQERSQILKAFAKMMDDLHQSFPTAEIYIVAHSEGTVVSFLGLLEAFRQPQPPGWTEQVRGLMTLGSPIDKHLILWPELFGQTPPTNVPQKRIEWRNYYDFGDPVGFALDDARAWIEINHWDGVFHFRKQDDFGFARYPLPGKAHVDYWTDEEVFGHFIETVVNDGLGNPAGKPTPVPRKPPADKRQAQGLSYALPYAGIVALLFIASYFLFKAVAGAIFPNGVADNTYILRGVTGLAGLIFGITVMARVPRLTRSRFWRSIAAMVAFLTAGLYLWSVNEATAVEIPGFSIPPGGITVALAAVLAALVYGISAARPSWGLKPMLFLGTAAVAGRVGLHLWNAQKAADIGPLWPVFIAMVGVLYLWWLAALLFDLVFVWHLYIRHSKMLQRMDEIMGGWRDTDSTSKAGQSAVGQVVAPQVQS